MKNLRKLAVSLIAILGLAGCTVSGSSSKGSGSSASSADSSSVTSGESLSASGSSSILGSSSSLFLSLSSSGEIPPVEGLSPAEAAAEVASCWGGSSGELKDYPGIFGAYGAFSAASYSVEDIKGYVPHFVPEEFELDSDWEETDGTYSCEYINAISTKLEFYVYADVLYVDADGKIVDEGTEGATSVDATCIEVYAYTVE